MDRFKINDKVKLVENSQFFHQSGGTNGTILGTSSDTGFRWRVRWDNQHTNSYRDEDITAIPTIWDE